jgi:uroporphyrinogen-III decarboxylase
MFEACLKYKDYLVHTLPFDQEMGLPEKNWSLEIVFGNVVEEAWFGAEIVYLAEQVSATVPCYTGDRKWSVFEQGTPDPFGGIMAEMQRFYEYFTDRAARSEYKGRPVKVSPPFPVGTDGPLTVANGLRGPEIFEDMLKDPQYFHELMRFITNAVILRIRAWRAYLGMEERPLQGYLADDAIEFLSVKSYREHVLPYHREILAALWGEGPHSMHLCGNVQRHLPTLAQELRVKSFDTGFPIRFGALREEVGEEVEILGGVKVTDLVNGSPAEVARISREILDSGIRRGGRFIFKEANNLPPAVPVQNIQAMYAAVKEYGKF